MKLNQASCQYFHLLISLLDQNTTRGMTSFENIHINIVPQPYHNPTPKQLLPPNNQQSSTPKGQMNKLPTCFYHSGKEIAYFCKHPRCTLPLCEKCLTVHRMEHLNRKEIPMENVVTFNQCKKFILQQLTWSGSRVKSNQKQFQVDLNKYKYQLIQIVEKSLNKLKEQLLLQDKQNSILKVAQINQTIRNIEKENSLSDIIKAYQNFHQQRQLSQHSQTNAYSIIDQIKFVPDQKQLVQVIERGFLNCKFVKEELPANFQSKPNRDLYLKAQQSFNQVNKTPVSKLESLVMTSAKKINQDQQKAHDDVVVRQFPENAESQRIIQIKRQLRKSIFDQKQNKPTVQKSLSFNNLSRAQAKSTKLIMKEALFSDVKKYNIDGSNEQVILGKRKNIYTQNLNFGSRSSSESSFIRRSSSNSSLKYRTKGLNLISHKPIETDHYLKKQKESIYKIKQRLLTSQNEQISVSRDNLSDWKRVVNLTDSNASFRNSSRQRENIYHVKNQEPGGRAVKVQDSLDREILNPLEMRQLLMRKRMHTNKLVSHEDVTDLVQKQYEKHIITSRPQN